MRNTGEFVNANGTREVCTITREEWLAERAKTDEVHVVCRDLSFGGVPEF